jgi:hypothetical protein
LPHVQIPVDESTRQPISEQSHSAATEVLNPQQNPSSPGDAPETDAAEQVSRPTNSPPVEQMQPPTAYPQLRTRVFPGENATSPPPSPGIGCPCTEQAEPSAASMTSAKSLNIESARYKPPLRVVMRPGILPI